MDPITGITRRATGAARGTCSCPFCRGTLSPNSLAEVSQAVPPSSPKSNEIQALKTQDDKTRKHELAHLKAAGEFATGMPIYNLEQGPDGKLYANGGHVNVDMSPVSGNPEATIQKARTLKQAALAPDDPSSQDQVVAAKAQVMLEKAQAELARKTPAHSTISVIA